MSHHGSGQSDPMGRIMLTSVIGFVGLCILAFGIVQVLNGQRLAGWVIVSIGLFDLLMLPWIWRKF